MATKVTVWQVEHPTTADGWREAIGREALDRLILEPTGDDRARLLKAVRAALGREAGIEADCWLTALLCETWAAGCRLGAALAGAAAPGADPERTHYLALELAGLGDYRARLALRLPSEG